MVGFKLRVNLLRLTFCRSVFVLNEVVLGSQLTSLNVYLDHTDLSRMPLEEKLVLTVLGRIIFICLCFCWCLCFVYVLVNCFRHFVAVRVE